MFIYRIYNVETNESYIGQTLKTINYRFKEHIREAKRALRCEQQYFPYFHRMLIYYGENKFRVELLEEVDNSLADEREIYWIEYYDSYYNGYNSTKGGQNRPMPELSKEAQAKWKDFSPENTCKTKIQQTIGINIKDVIALGLYDPKGNCNAGKQVEQYDKKGNYIATYPAATIASQETGISPVGIRSCCNGHLKTSGGFIWKWKEK